MRTTTLALVGLGFLAACSGSKDEDSAGTTDATGDTDETPGTTDEGDTDDEDDNDGPTYPSGDPTSCNLVGGSYGLDFNGANVVQPAALGALLTDAIGDSLALGVLAQGDTSMSVFLALMDAGAQDMCAPTAHPDEGTWADPVFAVGPGDLTVAIDGSPVTLSSFKFTAAANTDCASIRDGVFEADLDARLLGPLMEDLLGTTDPQEICDALVTFGAQCGACASDEEPFCVSLIIDNISGPATSTPIVPVTPEGIAENEDCG
jgi:hypothetical protein